MTSLRFRRRAALAFVISVLGAAIVAPLPASATPTLAVTFNYEIHTSCISGHGPASTTLHVALRGAGGGYQGHFVVDTDTNGDFSNSCFWGDVDAGDNIVATDGTNSRTFVVPPLSATVNRVSDVVAGTASPNSSVDIFIHECQTSWSLCNLSADKTRPTSSTGKYSYDFTSMYDIRGGDDVGVTWTSPQGDVGFLSFNAPQLTAWLNNNNAWGIGKSLSRTNVYLFDKMGNRLAKASDVSNLFGSFSVEFFRNHRAVDIEVGDFIGANFSSEAPFKVISFHVVTDTAADTVTAKCYRHGAYSLYVEHSVAPYYSMQVLGVADGNGNISVDTMSSSSYDLTSGDRLDLECRMATGDEIEESSEVQ